jgi:hypothetical protein
VFTAAVFFVRDSVTSPYEQPWDWGRRDGVDETRLAAGELIPDDAVVRAAPKLLPLLTERTGLFQLALPNDQNADAPALADEAAEGVNWIIFDLSEVPEWRAEDGGALRVGQFCAQLAGKGWLPVLRERGIIVYTFAEVAESMSLPVAFRDAETQAVC